MTTVVDIVEHWNVIAFWPLNVVKCSISCQNVSPSILPFVCLSDSWSMPKEIRLPKYALHYAME